VRSTWLHSDRDVIATSIARLRQAAGAGSPRGLQPRTGAAPHRLRDRHCRCQRSGRLGIDDQDGSFSKILNAQRPEPAALAPPLRGHGSTRPNRPAT